jgi:hypothetical protein
MPRIGEAKVDDVSTQHGAEAEAGFVSRRFLNRTAVRMARQARRDQANALYALLSG